MIYMPQTLKLACIIDDDTIYVRLMKKLLELKKLSKEIIVFKNGREAIDFFKNTAEKKLPELILLDLNMPVMNGWEFLNEYNSIKSTLNISPSLYVVSSSIDPLDSKKAKEISGVEDYIAKPISAEAFEKICEEVRNK